MSRRGGSPFKLIGIPAFDARKGYRRCVVAGVDVAVAGGPLAKGDLWRDGDGELVMRLSSQGYREHCRAVLRNGQPIPDARLDELGDYVSGVLMQWLIDGVDDTPEAFGE